MNFAEQPVISRDIYGLSARNIRTLTAETTNAAGHEVRRRFVEHRKRDTAGQAPQQVLIRFGDDLLSHVLRRSTIGATVLNGRVRDGIVCFTRAMITKPNKNLLTASTDRSEFQVKYTDVCFDCPNQALAWLLLDQIKPIGQLVPVS